MELINAALAPIRALSGACMRISKQFTILDRNGDPVLPTSVLGKRARGEEEPAGEESRWAKRAKLCPITLSVLSSCGLKHAPKPAQIAAVDAVREGRDTFYASPTSTGKGEAIRYLNHLLGKGTLIVVEPLVSLTKEFAERFGDLAAYVDSTNKDDRLLKDIRAGKYRIVFITPNSAVEGDFLNEVLMKEDFRKQAVGFVFDEAHTLDQWGHDFRPKFLKLGRVRRHLNVPALVMSATLTKEARLACELTLEMQRPLFIDVGTDRPNLHRRVLPMQHPIAGFLDVLSVLPELWQSAAEGASTVERMKKFLVTLVYINSKDAATNLKHVLDKWCLRAGFKNIVQLYHADLTDEHRSKILMLINTGKILIQRMGRAGRDFADEAEAILFVEPTHMTAEMRKHIAATGELPAPPEIDEVDEDGPITLENDVALIRSGTDSRAVAKKIVDDELLMLARHGLERDACIRRLVLDHLAQPKAETLPRHEELYHSSRPIPPGRELPCCSTCD
ncbi:unnamed protein product [Tilletia controversa]|nr:unnamed protein product [Tilletia laevis]CAD6942673.1 unnamed protein product [Tilletia controversa]